MTAQEMADRIFDLIAVSRGVTFAEIFNVIGEEARENLTWEISPNTALWRGISQTLYEAFKLMHQEIVPQWTNFLIYVNDGEVLNLPIGKTISKTGYKKPHWYPVVFRFRLVLILPSSPHPFCSSPLAKEWAGRLG